MRDLSSRLREIIRQDVGRPRDPARHELTYVPELGAAEDAEAVAARLGGRLHHAGSGACVVIDRLWDSTEWHGRRRVATLRPEADAPIALFDRRAAARSDWAHRVVFFDVETTGLSGGAGTLAFLAGCGWFEDDGFRVRQFFLSGPSGESAMLDALGSIFSEATLLVTYNGRSFDVPVMDMRWAFHRSDPPTGALPHFDMLPPARRLWGIRGRKGGPPALEDPRSCTLGSIERSVLGFHRVADVPGIEIPSRYFRFLRTGRPEVIDGVLEHNRHDLISLAAVMAHALWLAREGPEACREPTERLALGRLYERAGQTERARQAFEYAAVSGDWDVRRQALARLAVMLRRERRYDESAAAWQDVLALVAESDPGLGPLDRRATEALAIHHEHRTRDLQQARRYAERLRTDVTGSLKQDAEHRLRRLDRKLKSPSTPDELNLRFS